MDKNHIKKFIASKYEAFISDPFYKIKEEKIQFTDSETYLIKDFVFVDGEPEEGDVEFAERPIEVSVNFGEFVFGSFMFRKSNKVDYLIHKDNKLHLEFFDMLMDYLILIEEITNSLPFYQKNIYIESKRDNLKMQFEEVFSSISIITEYSQQTIFSQIDSIFGCYFKYVIMESKLWIDPKTKIPFKMHQDKVATLIAMLLRAGFIESSQEILAQHFSEYFSCQKTIGRSKPQTPKNFSNLNSKISSASISIYRADGSFETLKQEILRELAVK